MFNCTIRTVQSALLCKLRNWLDEKSRPAFVLFEVQRVALLYSIIRASFYKDPVSDVKKRLESTVQIV